MKKVKFALLFIVLAALAIVYHANQEYFLAKQSLDISLHVDLYKTPEIPNGLYFLGCFLTGLLIALAYAAMIKYRAYKTVKLLNTTITEQTSTIGELQVRVETLERANGIQPAPKEAAVAAETVVEGETVVEAEAVEMAEASGEETKK